jgi:beclin 1
MKELLRVEEAIGRAAQEDEAKIAAELRMLEAEEAELDKQLLRLDDEERMNGAEIQRLLTTKASLENEESQFWRDVNNYERNLVGFQESLTSADALIGTLGAQYARLKSTNILSEVFHISTVEEIGTISGFRLGRLPTTEVKNDEVNAALGQCLYLLTVLAHRFSYKFERYDIVLCGAFSSISLR